MKLRVIINRKARVLGTPFDFGHLSPVKCSVTEDTPSDCTEGFLETGQQPEIKLDARYNVTVGSPKQLKAVNSNQVSPEIWKKGKSNQTHEGGGALEANNYKTLHQKFKTWEANKNVLKTDLGQVDNMLKNKFLSDNNQGARPDFCNRREYGSINNEIKEKAAIWVNTCTFSPVDSPSQERRTKKKQIIYIDDPDLPCLPPLYFQLGSSYSGENTNTN